jgi:hypothetical protein
MNASASLVSVHLAGEGKDEIVLDTLPGKLTVTRTDEALTPYGGLAAWSGFLKHLGIIERLADHCPVARTSPNAAPVREVLHSFLLGALVEGKRFCPVRWVMDDPAVATLMGMERVRGEDALPRLEMPRNRTLPADWHRASSAMPTAAIRSQSAIFETAWNANRSTVSIPSAWRLALTCGSTGATRSSILSMTNMPSRRPFSAVPTICSL